MDVTPSGMAIEVKFEQLLNANTLMVVNWELGPKVTDVKLEQVLNKNESKSVTPSGMAIEVKFEQKLNALLSMVVN